MSVASTTNIVTHTVVPWESKRHNAASDWRHASLCARFTGGEQCQYARFTTYHSTPVILVCPDPTVIPSMPR